jgi:hypothetical protein
VVDETVEFGGEILSCDGQRVASERPAGSYLHNWHYAARRAHVIEGHAHDAAVGVDAAGAPQPATGRWPGLS